MRDPTVNNIHRKTTTTTKLNLMRSTSVTCENEKEKRRRIYRKCENVVYSNRHEIYSKDALIKPKN